MASTFLKKDTPLHRIRVWQADKGLSDDEVAEAFGVHKRTVDRWCEAKNFPTLMQAQLVSEKTDGYVGLMCWETEFVKDIRAKSKRNLKAKAKRSPKTTKSETGGLTKKRKPSQPKARAAVIRKKD